MHLQPVSKSDSAISVASASVERSVRMKRPIATRGDNGGARRRDRTDLDEFKPNEGELLKMYASMANGATVKRWAAMVQCGERYWLSSLLDYYKMGIPLSDRPTAASYEAWEGLLLQGSR